jgi:hypothetical protein
MKNLLVTLLSIFILSACNEQKSGKGDAAAMVPSEDTALKGASSEDSSMLASTAAARADTSLSEVINAVLEALDKRDYTALAGYIHPEKGVRFSPYGYIDTNAHQHFSKDAFLDAMKANRQMKWGSYDGSGDPIQLTVINYFNKFVYDKKYKDAPEVGLNRQISKGNSLNNLSNIYPNSIFTELYFPGDMKKYNGMDWKSLKLVFLRYNGKPYLVGVVHDQWTT